MSSTLIVSWRLITLLRISGASYNAKNCGVFYANSEACDERGICVTYVWSTNFVLYIDLFKGVQQAKSVRYVPGTELYHVKRLYSNGLRSIFLFKHTKATCQSMIACVQGSTNGTNGITISFKVLPMVPLVIPLVPMVMPMVQLALPMVPLISQWYHW